MMTSTGAVAYVPTSSWMSKSASRTFGPVLYQPTTASLAGGAGWGEKGGATGRRCQGAAPLMRRLMRYICSW